MAENVPPGSAGAANEAANRGIPYYEKLRRDLRDTINKKRTLDKNMANLEESIFRLESSYLEETAGAGNIIKGFDNYIKGSSIGTSSAAGGGGTISGSAIGGAGGRRKIVVQDTDRVFSRSSVGTVKTDTDSPVVSSQTTPSHAATPTETTGTKAGNNKKKKKSVASSAVDDDEGSAAGSAAEGGNKKNKRLKISYGRD